MRVLEVFLAWECVRSFLYWCVCVAPWCQSCLMPLCHPHNTPLPPSPHLHRCCKALTPCASAPACTLGARASAGYTT